MLCAKNYAQPLVRLSLAKMFTIWLENSTKKEKVCCQMKPTYYKLQELKNISHSDVGAITQVLTNENGEVFCRVSANIIYAKGFQKILNPRLHTSFVWFRKSLHQISVISCVFLQVCFSDIYIFMRDGVAGLENIG